MAFDLGRLHLRGHGKRACAEGVHERLVLAVQLSLVRREAPEEEGARFPLEARLEPIGGMRVQQERIAAASDPCRLEPDSARPRPRKARSPARRRAHRVGGQSAGGLTWPLQPYQPHVPQRRLEARPEE